MPKPRKTALLSRLSKEDEQYGDTTPLQEPVLPLRLGEVSPQARSFPMPAVS